MSAGLLLAFLACVVVATAAQSVTGFALALILLGLSGLFDLAPLPDVANVATVLSLLNAVIWLRGTHKSLDWRILRPTVVGTVAGVAAGVALLAWLSNNVVLLLRLLLGVVVIGCAIVVLVRTRPLPAASSSASFHGYGFLSGVLGGLFSASGPPLVYQFYRQPMTIAAIRDTLVAALAAGNVIRLLLVAGTGQFGAHSLLLCALSAPVALGLSWWFKRHPPAWPRESVLKLVAFLLVLTGIGLVAPALQQLLP